MSADAAETFRALVLDQRDGVLAAEIRTLSDADLPVGDLTIDVSYSSLNYKDGLSITGAGKIARFFPMVPGIDLAGTVRHSDAPGYKPGDAVLVTGWGIGERHWGGFAERARVKSEWVTKIPPKLTAARAMALGTAGLTAMLCVLAIQEAGVDPAGREVLVTGAAGGVGSVAVAVLASLGYRVVASSGRPEQADFLRSLGATEVIDRAAVAAPGKPLESERWGGVIDTVGGETLAGALRAVAYNGAVAACGNAGGIALSTTVFPFILRGVRLIGVESVQCPAYRREIAWARLVRDMPAELLDGLTTTIALTEIPAAAQQIVAGQIRGRTVVDLAR